MGVPRQVPTNTKSSIFAADSDDELSSEGAGGPIAACANRGAGQPRPALIAQSDPFAALPSVVICPLTTMIRDDAGQFWLLVDPSERSGLGEAYQIAIDIMTVVSVAKSGGVIGEADDAPLLRVNRAEALFLGIV